jgi:hypothetical protein
MKPRYNCATTNRSAPKAHKWKFILQSDRNNETTICDVGAIVDDLGGPAALSGATVAILGNSFQRQIYEAIACKFQDQLTRALVMKDPPSISLDALESRGDKPFSIAEYGESISIPLDERPIPRCSGSATDFGQFFYPDVSLTTPHLVDACSDDLSLMEFNNNFRVFFNFHPERLENTQESYKKIIGFDVSDLTHVAFNANTDKFFQRRRIVNNATWANYSPMLPTLKRMQRRDTGQWFGAKNPFVKQIPDVHSCLPGIADDEASLFLFSLIFGIEGFVYPPLKSISLH